MTDPIDPPSAATAPPPIRRLRRLVRGKPVGPLEAKLGGVSAGIGRYLSIEPIYLRAAFAVALLFNGVGALLYLAAWLLMPNDDDRRPQPIVPTDSVLRLIAGGAVLVGGVAVITDPFSINVGDLFVPLVLIAAGVWFLDRRPDINPPTQPAPPMGQPASTWNPTSGVSPSTVSGSTALLDPPAPTAHWATPLAAEPEARVPVATIALAGTAALFGLALLLDSFDAIDPDPVVYAAIPCLGFGLGLVASALIRGARSGLLVLLSLFSLLPLALTAASGPALFGGVGEALTIVVGELDGDYRWGIGEHVVDLRNADVDGVQDVHIDQSFGSVRIIVPSDVDVEVDASIKGGSATAFGHSVDGTDVRLQRRDAADGGELDSADLLRLDVDLQFGEIVVTR